MESLRKLIRVINVCLLIASMTWVLLTDGLLQLTGIAVMLVMLIIVIDYGEKKYNH